ncbi:MAG TPA: 1,4-alpha-glucan branching protein domain-containing protein [Chthoniobacterales bacterium]|jgi:1,4-alpha-glucan branching enzyme|nr:1,4-alpha-glucan branching protein domain-containing protein [Chthoniobacterales bacterium]
MATGYLALVLHAHLPFVRHPEHEEFLEEDWLFEAITESYIPLLAMMERLVRDEVPFKLTMTVTPTLSAMLQDQLLRERYLRHLDRSVALAEREIDRNRADDRLRMLAEFYHRHFSQTRHRFLEWNGDLIGVFRRLHAEGVLELAASAATHGLLPLFQQSNEAVRAQVQIGCDAFRSAFNTEPAGFWLPECGYYPGLENILRDANLRWFIIDAHGLMLGDPRPRRAIYAPCFTPAGPAVFARHRDSSRRVWSASDGYPGNPAYREFYRDIGFELPLEYLWPETRSPIRKFTGMKYHRVTAREGEKELYDPTGAAAVAEEHAASFLEMSRQNLNGLRALDFDPIVLAAFDAELFGHWWFEGPLFLESFIRQAAHGQQNLRLTSREQFGREDFQLTSPGDFLAAHPTQQTVSPAASSWGDKGYLGVWLDQTNSWIHPHLHAAAERLTRLARANRNDPSPDVERVLRQLGRELLLAQASDWPFLIRTGTAKHYATKRVTDHLMRFNRLYDQASAGNVDAGFLANCEWRDNIFPDMDWRYYR